LARLGLGIILGPTFCHQKLTAPDRLALDDGPNRFTRDLEWV